MPGHFHVEPTLKWGFQVVLNHEVVLCRGDLCQGALLAVRQGLHNHFTCYRDVHRLHRQGVA